VGAEVGAGSPVGAHLDDPQPGALQRLDQVNRVIHELVGDAEGGR
jgi:hypothetical protein